MADFDYKKMRDYVSADPEVTKLREKRTNNWKKIKQLKTNAQSHIEKMHGLYLAKTAVMAKVQYEPAGSDGSTHIFSITSVFAKYKPCIFSMCLRASSLCIFIFECAVVLCLRSFVTSGSALT